MGSHLITARYTTKSCKCCFRKPTNNWGLVTCFSSASAVLCNNNYTPEETHREEQKNEDTWGFLKCSSLETCNRILREFGDLLIPWVIKIWKESAFWNRGKILRNCVTVNQNYFSCSVSLFPSPWFWTQIFNGAKNDRALSTQIMSWVLIRSRQHNFN